MLDQVTVAYVTLPPTQHALEHGHERGLKLRVTSEPIGKEVSGNLIRPGEHPDERMARIARHKPSPFHILPVVGEVPHVVPTEVVPTELRPRPKHVVGRQHLGEVDVGPPDGARRWPLAPLDLLSSRIAPGILPPERRAPAGDGRTPASASAIRLAKRRQHVAASAAGLIDHPRRLLRRGPEVGRWPTEGKQRGGQLSCRPNSCVVDRKVTPSPSSRRLARLVSRVPVSTPLQDPTRRATPLIGRHP